MKRSRIISENKRNRKSVYDFLHNLRSRRRRLRHEQARKERPLYDYFLMAELIKHFGSDDVNDI